MIGTATAALYTFSWMSVPAGNYSLTAVATNDGGGTTTSAPVAIKVDSPPSVTLDSPANAAVFAQGVAVSLSATPADTVGAVTRVDFYEGANLVGTASWTPAAAGAYSLTAVATNDANMTGTSSAVSIAVDAAPSVSISSPADGSSFTAPANIAVAVTVGDTVGTVTKVDFYQGGTLITTVTAAPFGFTWTNVPVGNYSLTAIATNDAGETTTSAAVSVTVKSGIAQVYYIETDHLNTPRLIADSTGNTVWQWNQGEPFGNDVPNNNPSGAGAFDFNLRYDGQYADAETGLFYNVTRDYLPGIGRYIEADLAGGVLFKNTAMPNLGSLGVVHPELIALLYSKQPKLNDLHSYVGSNPLSYSDPLGLFWLIECYKCFKKQNEMEDAFNDCKKEYEKCKTLKDEIEFIEQYGGGFVSSAIFNCATQKSPGTFSDMIKSCGACGVAPKGPWPLKK